MFELIGNGIAARCCLLGHNDNKPLDRVVNAAAQRGKQGTAAAAVVANHWLWQRQGTATGMCAAHMNMP
jgi:hypothetical protein